MTSTQYHFLCSQILHGHFLLWVSWSNTRQVDTVSIEYKLIYISYSWEGVMYITINNVKTSRSMFTDAQRMLLFWPTKCSSAWPGFWRKFNIITNIGCWLFVCFLHARFTYTLLFPWSTARFYVAPISGHLWILHFHTQQRTCVFACQRWSIWKLSLLQDYTWYH